MSRWYRAYEGTVTDAKLAEASLLGEVSRSVAIAAWHCILESAASANNCGSYSTNPRRVALILCEPVERIEALFAAYQEIGLLLEDRAVASWTKRQHESDSSAERTRKWREKNRQKKAECDGCDDDETSRDAPETEAETEDLSSDEDRQSADSLDPKLVFEGYQVLAGELGLPVPRDLTPERRQLTRGRITQYPLDDFLAAFAKCRGSPFLRGDKGRTPLTFDWLMKKANFQKVLEGNYDS